MPARKDIKKILIIGSGPIVIGQACEFDYSGNQAVRALKEEGYQVILVNTNPATIMTQPGLADAIYMDPLEVPYLEEIIKKERPDAVLPTMGGQTALNLTMALNEAGVFERYGVEILGANIKAIQLAEDRGLFKKVVESIGLESAKSVVAQTMSEAMAFARENGLPLIIRPSFTLGGRGGSIANRWEEVEPFIQRALDESPVHQVLIEESLLGWKEFEMEVMRDKADNAVIICSIENVDPMGVHTGDSITVAPIQTLSDVEYQKMRTASINILRAIGVDCGGSNVQFAMHPSDGRMVVIEMNPRVSRSSALASKATGFPIARSSAKLAVGYTLDEILNDITGKTVSCFEPSLDYVAVKVPRFELEKFPRGYAELGTQMKSVGESLAIGRSYQEALNKAIRACEFGFAGLEDMPNISDAELERMQTTRHPRRIFAAYTALKRIVVAAGGLDAAPNTAGDIAYAGAESKLCKGAETAAMAAISTISEKTGFDPWFLYNGLEQIVLELTIAAAGKPSGEGLSGGLDNKGKPSAGKKVPCSAFGADLLLQAKRMGLADKHIARLSNRQAAEIEAERNALNLHANFHFVDTCSGEFEAKTPYFYSTYGEMNEAMAMSERGVIILASGPNRIGQGLEFDTCCTMSSLAYRKQGVKTVIINSNPETVSTDFNVSDRLYIEPLTVEDVKEIMLKEGIPDVVVQLGGQTPLNMSEELEAWGARVVGTSVSAIKAAEDRKLFAALMDKLNLRQPPNRTVASLDSIKAAAAEVGYPVLIRPSFVLGGRAMSIAYDEQELEDFLARQKGLECNADRPILVDKFLEDAYEYDLDGLSDGKNVYVAGVMQHIEAAGIHSGDSACVFPSYKSSPHLEKQMIEACAKIAREIGVKGFINIQFAVKDDTLYIIEVNPRASRTVPFIGKASGINLVEAAVRLWDGTDLRQQGLINDDKTGILNVGLGECITGWAVKEAMFSFDRFRDVDPVLGPEMKSTGEVIGLGATFGEAFSKTQSATGTVLPIKGTVFVTVNKFDRQAVLPIIRGFKEAGFHISATRGTAEFLFKNGIFAEVVLKVHEGHPHIVDHMEHGRIAMVINTPLGRYTQKDDDYIRIEAVRRKIPYTTTISAATAALEGIRYLIKGEVTPRALPEGRIVT